jgi:DedD protein
MAAENGMPENEDVRKKALLRLAVAGVVTAAALAGLWWLDQGAERQKTASGENVLPAPILPAPAPDVAPPQTESQAGAKPADDQAEAAPTDKAEEIPGEPPPPPKVSNAPRMPPPAPQAASSSPRPAAPLPTQQATPAAAQPPATSAVPPGKGFVVQLGVFSNPDNAREMVEKLNRQGIRAHLEARVQLGPFLNRQEAEKAQAEMRRMGYKALVTTAYPTK